MYRVKTKSPEEFVARQDHFAKHVFESCADFLGVAEWGIKWEGKDAFTVHDHLRMLKRCVTKTQWNNRSARLRLGSKAKKPTKIRRGHGDVKRCEEPSIEEFPQINPKDVERNEKLGMNKLYLVIF